MLGIEDSQKKISPNAQVFPLSYSIFVLVYLHNTLRDKELVNCRVTKLGPKSPGQIFPLLVLCLHCTICIMHASAIRFSLLQLRPNVVKTFKVYCSTY